MSPAEGRQHPKLIPGEGAHPALRFSPYAWAKLHWFCHRGETEIGGFGISATDDPLLIQDFVTVKQDASAAEVTFDDEAVADFFDRQVDAGRRPDQFARLWLHTHPGGSAVPSTVDEETFERAFGTCHWAVMVILSKQGKTHARLRFNVGPEGDLVIPVCVDFDQPFEGSDRASWEQEYAAHVTAVPLLPHESGFEDILECLEDSDWIGDFDPCEREPARGQPTEPQSSNETALGDLPDEEARWCHD